VLLEVFPGWGDKLDCCKLVSNKHCQSKVYTDEVQNHQMNSPTVLESRDDRTNESTL
jgi:hypothetical protein